MRRDGDSVRDTSVVGIATEEGEREGQYGRPGWPVRSAPSANGRPADPGAGRHQPYRPVSSPFARRNCPTSQMFTRNCVKASLTRKGRYQWPGAPSQEREAGAPACLEIDGVG